MMFKRLAPIAEAVFPVLFVLSLGQFLFFTFWTLHDPVVDYWGFRPAQTVASVPYMLSEGAWLANILPVFGEPWIFPQEFPLYQWAVAVLSWATGLSAGAAGRLASAAFAVACIWPISLLAAELAPASRRRLTLVLSTLWLLSPTVIFWGRSSVIETTTVFLGACWLAFCLRFLRGGRPLDFAACLAFGILAACVKITAFVGFVAAGGFGALYFLWRNGLGWRSLLRVGLSGVAVAVPVAALAGWSAWCNSYWRLNPLSNLLIVSNMPLWYFGEWKDRLGRELWDWVLGLRVLPNLLGAWWQPAAIAVLAVALYVRRFTFAVAAILCFVVGYLIFPRLFMYNIHYEMENALFLLGVIAVATVALSERAPLVAAAALTVFAGSMALSFYQGTYFEAIAADLRRHPYVQAAEKAREATPEDSVIVVFGTGWGSDIPFLAGRRGIVVANWFPPETLEDVLFTNRGRWLGQRPVGAVADCDVYASQKPEERYEPLRARIRAEMDGPSFSFEGPVVGGAIERPVCRLHLPAR